MQRTKLREITLVKGRNIFLNEKSNQIVIEETSNDLVNKSISTYLVVVVVVVVGGGGLGKSLFLSCYILISFQLH